MAGLTYAQLVQKLQAWSEDFGSSFTTGIDEGIADAEMMISRDLNIDQMRFQATINFVAGTYTYTKPTGAVTIRHISYVDANSKIVFLELRRREYIMDYAPYPTVIAQRAAPKFWDNYETLDPTTQVVTSQIYVGPTPVAAAVATAECEGRIKGLSITITTTWLSTYQPDLLFAACIKKMARFEQEPEMAKTWDDDYNSLLSGVQIEVMRIRSDATSVQRTA